MVFSFAAAISSIGARLYRINSSASRISVFRLARKRLWAIFASKTLFLLQLCLLEFCVVNLQVIDAPGKRCNWALSPKSMLGWNLYVLFQIVKNVLQIKLTWPIAKLGFRVFLAQNNPEVWEFLLTAHWFPLNFLDDSFSNVDSMLQTIFPLARSLGKLLITLTMIIWNKLSLLYELLCSYWMRTSVKQ